MPPRHVYWTIILEGKPTAFRAHTQEELLPTLKQLQAKHPDAEMKWFARGKLWHSPEEEKMAFELKRSEKRGPKWRPGGDHVAEGVVEGHHDDDRPGGGGDHGQVQPLARQAGQRQGECRDRRGGSIDRPPGRRGSRM